MSNKIGRFEIINEIARSEIGCTYKASDTESGHTVALKTINLQLLGDQAEAVVQRIVQEHSGKVHAANRPGGGAVITVRLPVPET